jgi:hypothetical protein
MAGSTNWKRLGWHCTDRLRKDSICKFTTLSGIFKKLYYNYSVDDFSSASNDV